MAESSSAIDDTTPVTLQDNARILYQVMLLENTYMYLLCLGAHAQARYIYCNRFVSVCVSVCLFQL